MARPLRIEYPGAVYHVTSRGNGGNAIFLDDGDRRSFLHVFDSVVKKSNWLCHAFCLMDNHYHILIETPDGNLSRGMRQLNGVYTQAFNRRYDTAGHIFQGRFKAILVEKEVYLLQLSRYLVMNPVRAGMVEQPAHWKWSSYPATAGMRKVPSYLTVDWILGQFGRSKAEARQRYKRFVKSDTKDDAPWQGLKGQIFLGGEAFLKKVRSLSMESEGIKEVPRVQRYAHRPPLEKLLPEKAVRANRQRNKTLYEAHVKYGYSLKEIADCLGVHYTTVSKAVKAAEEKN
jgi:REP element-mobilizing transposase RayT